MSTQFTTDWRKRLLDPLAWALSRRELRRLMARTEVDGIVDATEDYQGRGYYARIHAVQNRWEILELTRRVQALRPKVVVEIGTYKGGTLYIWCRAVPGLRLAVSIDLPGGAFGGGYDARRERLFQEFLADRPGQLSCLRADSHAPETAQDLRRVLDGEPIDFLYIDGDHRYAGVRQDFEMYGPMVRPGGMVAFHDIVTRTGEHEVHTFWQEIRGQYRHEELVANPAGNKGIGILHV